MDKKYIDYIKSPKWEAKKQELFKEKGKKNPKNIPLPDDIQMLLPKGKKDSVEKVEEVVEDNSNNEGNIEEIVQDLDNESNGELPSDLFGGGPLSSDERNNMKTVIVNNSFF